MLKACVYTYCSITFEKFTAYNILCTLHCSSLKCMHSLMLSKPNCLYFLSLPPSLTPLCCHRMIPPSSKNFLVNNLAAGTQYDLCVLAIYDDVITSLTATRVVGCVQFTTESEYMRCHFMQSQFLGGTMIIIIGGIIVASVLVFIIILMIRYKVGLCLSHLIPSSQKKGKNKRRAFFIMWRDWFY